MDKLFLGNIDSKRDWGYAPDYVEAMWKMLQIDDPNDFVIATGKMNSVREFVEKAFEFVDIEIIWKGKGIDEKGINSRNGKTIIEIDPWYYRPTEVDILVGNPLKAKEILKLEATVKYDELIEIMMNHALETR